MPSFAILRPDRSDLFLDIFGLLRVTPNHCPVRCAVGGFHASDDHFNEEIGRIGDILSIMTMLPEIFENGISGFTNRSEVIGVSTWRKGKNTVKLLVLVLASSPRSMVAYLLKLLLIGLVNGTENSKSLFGQATKQRNYTGGTLTVESTCRLIQKQEKSRSST